jgi:hypothetical protein
MNAQEVTIGEGYPRRQLARAFATAAEHEDEATRERARERIRRWESVLDGMADGTLSVGSRTPVDDLPAWVTLEVVRGGFATGAAAAEGPLRAHERDLALRAGLPAERTALFAHCLTDAGLAELTGLLASGRYRVELPEEAALLVVAWLVRSGDRAGALALVDTLAPFAGRLRFLPARGAGPAADPHHVSRQTVAAVRRAIAGRQPNGRVEAMREALAVWNPFADDLLTLWNETTVDGRVAARLPEGWPARAAALLARYRELAAEHTRCTKHRKPKENLGILVRGLVEIVANGRLEPRLRGLVHHAVTSMLRKRGEPGSANHAALREWQAAVAVRPGHHRLAAVVAERLAGLPQDSGTAEPGAVLHPVRVEEARATGVPAGWPIPPSLGRVVARATAGTVEELVEAGVVGSAEVLAQLTPQITGAVTAAAYPDPDLARLMAATYRAFRSRRSLLLLNLEHQVRLDELPWVRAVAGARVDGDDVRDSALGTLRRMGAAFLAGFPATAMPNPLIREFAVLSDQAGLGLPWVEELAADIFMGTFSVKFLRAAKLAAGLLAGSLYERYYDIDYTWIAGLEETEDKRWGVRTSPAFDDLCGSRAVGRRSRRSSVAANGTVIEQAQILTTHNLATLAAGVGAEPATGWAGLADRALDAVFRLVAQTQRNPRPLSTVKDAAYAWRQMVFYLSLADEPDQFLAAVPDRVATRSPYVRERLAPALAGLAHVGSGARFAPDGTADDGAADGRARRFLGWTTERHWLLS